MTLIDLLLIPALNSEFCVLDGTEGSTNNEEAVLDVIAFLVNGFVIIGKKCHES
jgi:hypothetical protein